ncbi:MAG: glycosyltransferase family 9 protein [Nanoarchaeota archaeon]|nr:glycosyltransferase family 9 protein [Nanoarchaeota archaeon]
MEKIIIIAVNTGLGNVLMVTPLIKETKNLYPNSEITILVSNSSCAKILEKNPYIRRIIILNKGKHKLDNLFPLKGFKKLVELRKGKFDISVTIMPHSYYGSFCAFLIGAKRRLSNYLCKMDYFQNEIIELKKVHDALQNVNLINQCHGKSHALKIYLDKKEIKPKIRKNIGIHPGCGKNYDFKRWEMENFIRLAKKLTCQGFKITFFIGPGEEKFIEPLKKFKDFEIVGGVSLRNTIIKINQCEYFISNDSGLMHLAEALNIPSLTIFGPSDYRRTGPMPSEKRIIITPENYIPIYYTLEEIGKKERVIPKGEKINWEGVNAEKVYKKFLELIKKV